VEWSRGDRAARRDGDKPAANTKPTKTLFVINFDPINTRVSDIERHFAPFGNISNVRIRRNFAFVQFGTMEEARKALEATHATTLLDRVISVEYAFRDDGETSDRYDSPRRGGGYGRRGDSPYRRSISPVYRSRPSPDYDRPPRSRPSPDYGRPPSPVYGGMAGAGVLFVIAIGDLLVTDQDPHLPKEELMTNSELSAIVVGAGSLYLLFPSVISTSSKDYCAVF